MILFTMKTTTDYKPIPAAQLDRIRLQVEALAIAKTANEALAALFLLHCELKDVEASLPAAETLEP